MVEAYWVGYLIIGIAVLWLWAGVAGIVYRTIQYERRHRGRR